MPSELLNVDQKAGLFNQNLFQLKTLALTVGIHAVISELKPKIAGRSQLSNVPFAAVDLAFLKVITFYNGDGDEGLRS